MPTASGHATAITASKVIGAPVQSNARRFPFRVSGPPRRPHKPEGETKAHGSKKTPPTDCAVVAHEHVALATSIAGLYEALRPRYA